MVEPWNDALLLPPPINTYKCENNFDIQKLSKTCSSIIKVLSKQSPLHREAAICSRFLYKFDKKFRNDIGYRSLKKVSVALRKYLLLNLLKHAENFHSLLPDQNEELYLPTKQMLEFFLLKLLTFSKIILRICICSKQAAVFYLDRLKRGESHWMSFMPYALLSRIWSISVVLLQSSCRWYMNLYSFMDKLKFHGMKFLPSEFVLPNDIEEWLDLSNLENIGKFKWSQKKQIKFEKLLAEDDEGDTLENILEFVDKINEKFPDSEELSSSMPVDKNIEQMQISSTIPELNNTTNFDQGEKISRDIFKSFFKNNDVNHSADMVTNKGSLTQFITTEEKLRNEDDDQALTGHLSFMQWQSLKKSLQSLLESLANNRKIERKFKKIWKEKCLDYK